MRVFIAYPREFAKLAEKLHADLNDRNFQAFLDTENIKLGDRWRLIIEAHIRKASVFIVLYDREAANRKSYFSVELELIKEEWKRNAETIIITVLLSPTEPKDLPPHLNNRQLIKATDTGNDDYLINNVAQEIKRLKSIQKRGNKAMANSYLPSNSNNNLSRNGNDCAALPETK